VLLILSPSAAVDSTIVATIALMFLGMGMLGVGTLVGKRLPGWRAWAPLLTVAAGVIAGAFYSLDKVVHFALLGLLWGPAWMLIAYLILTHTRQEARAEAHAEMPAQVRP
jgi:hypothetical protein